MEREGSSELFSLSAAPPFVYVLGLTYNSVFAEKIGNPYPGRVRSPSTPCTLPPPAAASASVARARIFNMSCRRWINARTRPRSRPRPASRQRRLFALLRSSLSLLVSLPSRARARASLFFPSILPSTSARARHPAVLLSRITDQAGIIKNSSILKC